MGKGRAIGVGLGVGAAAYLVYRSRLPLEERDRWGRRVMNERIAPALMRLGAANGRHAGMGIVEHVGRVSGTVRRTLVHPIALNGDRVAVPVPYAEGGQWPRNVLAAGGCRLGFRDQVFTLSNPRIVVADEIEGLPAGEKLIGKAIGGRFLVLDVASMMPGRLDEATS